MKPLKLGQVTLERALSKLGLASRTTARKWILEGKVRVNGILRRDPRFALVPERARIEIGGEQQEIPAPRTFLLNKPRGVITTHSDEKGRPTVFSLIQEDKLHLIAVGRLDWATSGLLLLTNDTQFSAWITHPNNEIPRVYLVSVQGRFEEKSLTLLEQGIHDQNELLQVDQVLLRKSSGKESHLVVTLTEGKNREIRRLFSLLGHPVTRLKRVKFGGLELGDLKPGEYREVSAQELRTYFPSAPIRSQAD